MTERIGLLRPSNNMSGMIDLQHKGRLQAVAQGAGPSGIALVAAALSTALFRIIGPLILLGGWSTAIVCINRFTSAELTVAPTLLTVLGTILGLVLSYRTSSAYDRYWEGRKLWSSLTVSCRNLGRLVWLHVPTSVDAEVAEAVANELSVGGKSSSAKELDRERALLEKTRMIELCLAFAVSVKHYLRGEDGIFYEDLYDLVKNLPTYNMPSGIPEAAEGNNVRNRRASFATFRSNDIEASPEASPDTTYGETSMGTTLRASKSSADFRDAETRRATGGQRPLLKPAHNPPAFDIRDYFPFNVFAFLATGKRNYGRQKKRLRKQFEQAAKEGGDKNSIPLEIMMYMSAYVFNLQKRKAIDASTTTVFLNSLNQLTDILASMERILLTPIPISYAAFIQEVAWVYCLLLPFQIYQLFGWLTIPATIIVTCILLGLVSCGQEIENPFGYDANDLNLDFFCESVIKQELIAMMEKSCEFPGQYFEDRYLHKAVKNQLTA